MSAEVKKEIELELAHVLFIDIVGYSKVLINEQRALLETLNEIVRSTEQFRKAEATGRLKKIPAGDGMALEAGRRKAPCWSRRSAKPTQALARLPVLLFSRGLA